MPLRRNDKGFSLVEVIAALIVFSIAIVTLVQGFAQSSAAQSDLIDRRQALMLAENLLEEARALNQLEEGHEEGEFDEFAGFRWERTIEESDLPDLMQVSAKVTWGPEERSRDYSLTTLMTRRMTMEEMLFNEEAMAGDSSAGTAAPAAGGAGGVTP